MMGRRQLRGASGFIGFSQWLIVAVTTVACGSPIIRSKFLGDDLEVWNAFKSGEYPSSINDALVYAGIEKWRPLNSVAMQLILRMLGNTYEPYWYLTSLLLLALAIAVRYTVRQLSSDDDSSTLNASWFGSIVIVSSPFTFMARSGVHGFLEITPILLCVVSYGTFVSATRAGTRLPVIYSSLLALSAALIHERYLSFSIAMMCLCICHARQSKNLRGMWMVFCGNGIFYVYTSAIVLRANPLKGGGADDFNEVIGWWFLPRVLHAIIHLLGGAGAATSYFVASNPKILSDGLKIRDNYNLFFPALIALSLCYGAIFFCRFQRSSVTCQSRNIECNPWYLKPFVQCGFISFIVLLPAATVNSRIEARWLFGPLVFFVIYLVGFANSEFRNIRRVSTVILATLFVANVVGRWSFEEFDWWRTRTERVLSVVEQNAPETGKWNVAIVVPRYPEGGNSAVWWGLNYGQAMIDYLDNAPNGIYFGTQDVVASCQSPCLVLTVDDDLNESSEIDQARSQTIVYRWINK